MGVPFLSFVFEIVFLPVFVYLCVCVLEEGLQYIGVSCCQIAARQRPLRTQHQPAEGKLRKVRRRRRWRRRRWGRRRFKNKWKKEQKEGRILANRGASELSNLKE